MKSVKYLQVSLSKLKRIVSVGTFHSAGRLVGDVFSMTAVLFREGEQSVDSLLV